MKYLITDTGIIRIAERAGLIQNASQSESVEISDSGNFTDVFVLPPLNERFFNKQLYIRAYGALQQPAEVNVVTFIAGGGTGGGSSSSDTDTDTASASDVDGYINNIFDGGDDSSNDSNIDDYLDGVFSGGDDDSNDSDFDSYLDDIFSNAG